MSNNRFIFAAILFIAAFPALALQESITCVSENNAFVRCALQQAESRNVVLSRTLSGNCNANGAWGADSAGIWVNHNCGAVFQYQGYSYNDTVEPYIYGYAYGPDAYYGPNYLYSQTGLFFGRGYYYNGHYRNGNNYHNPNGGYYHGGRYYHH
ncbi:MAG: DUF3011 domain-containing protein [Legionellales bacterium]|jgi:hypothetical protein